MKVSGGTVGFRSCVKLEGLTWEVLMMGFGCRWGGKFPIPPAEKERSLFTHICSLDTSFCLLDIGMSHLNICSKMSAAGSTAFIYIT